MKSIRNIVLSTCAILSVVAQAQSLSGTMLRLKETGEIRVGHRDVSVPFSYLTDEGKPIGFFMDICSKVVENIKAELKQDIKVVYRPVTLSTQIPLLQNCVINVCIYIH